MRNNQPVSRNRRRFSAEQKLISSTDLHGIIRHCNDAFVEVSGFSREELIGQPHNIVRHPDMPSDVFEVMWRYLKAGKPWMGVVKNRCRNGDFYWVNAYVTPVKRDGRIVGYESVRVMPAEEDVARAERNYQEILHHRKLPRTWGVRVWPVLTMGAAIGAAFLLQWWLGQYVSSGYAFLGAILPVVASCLMAQRKYVQDMRVLSDKLVHSFRDPVAIATYTTHRGLLGELETAIISDAAHLNTVITRLDDAAHTVAVQATEALALTELATDQVRAQQTETEQVATAMNQMSATINEVSAHVQDTAQRAADAEKLASDSRAEVQETRAAILNLRDTVEGICHSVIDLAAQTEQIASISQMIEQIAEQTNLLALNAAIEAARAGDQGRGFAVVADEVRQLALRTQDSIQQIHSTVSSLRERARAAVTAAERGQEAAAAGVEKVEITQKMLNGISDSVNRIADMSVQMAAAVEQQAQVSEDINRQVVRIADLAQSSLEQGDASLDKSHELEETAEEMHELVERFKR